MAIVIINEERLSAIGDAIRTKTGNSELLKVADMPAAIENIETGGGDGADIPEEAFTFSGNCSYNFKSGSWDWFLRDYGKKIKTVDISDATDMFASSSVETIPFELNFKTTNYVMASNMFGSCKYLKKIGKLNNLNPQNMNGLFSGCQMLRELPEIDLITTQMHENATYSTQFGSMFQNCISLRRIPRALLKELWMTYNSQYNCFYYTLMVKGGTLYESS